MADPPSVSGEPQKPPLTIAVETQSPWSGQASGGLLPGASGGFCAEARTRCSRPVGERAATRRRRRSDLDRGYRTPPSERRSSATLERLLERLTVCRSDDREATSRLKVNGRRGRASLATVVRPSLADVSRSGVAIGPLVVLGALSAFGPLSIDLYLPSLPGLAEDLGASASAAQLTLTACLLGLAAGQLVIGPWSDAIGRRRPLLIGVGAYIVVSVVCAVTPSILTLVGLRFVQGLAGAAGIVLSRAIVRDMRSGAAAARLFAGLLLVNGLAPILAPIIGGQLLRIIDWRGLFVVLAAVGVLIFAGSVIFVPESLSPAMRRAGGLIDTLRTFQALLKEPRFVGCAVASGLAFAAMFAYIGGSPFVLQRIYSLSPAQFSAVFAINALGLILAGQASSPLVGRLGPRAVLGAGLIIGAFGGVGLLGVVLGGVGLPGILPAFFLVVSSIGVITPSGTAIALEGKPSTAGSASGLLGLTQYAIGAVTVPLVGVAGKDTALPTAIVIAVCGIGALTVFGLLIRPQAASD